MPFEELRDLSAISILKLNDMLRDLYRTVQGGITRASLSSELLEEIDTVGSEKLEEGAVTADKIGDEAIAEYHVQDAAITNAKIANLSADKLTAGTINANDIDVINLTADHITGGTLDARIVSVANLRADSITGGTLDAKKVAVVDLDAGCITTGELDAANVRIKSLNAGEITVGKIIGEQIEYRTITSSHIDSITADLIKGGNLTLGGTVNGNTYDGEIELQLENTNRYGSLNRQGLAFYGKDGLEVLTVKNSGLTLGDSQIGVYSTNGGAGLAIFA